MILGFLQLRGRFSSKCALQVRDCLLVFCICIQVEPACGILIVCVGEKFVLGVPRR